jgi:hypothetical protein
MQPVRLVLNLIMLFFLMRLWPMGGRLGLGESETLVMSVPFSEFVRRVRHDDVNTVSVDGLHISFSLKPGSLSLPGELDLAVACACIRTWGCAWWQLPVLACVRGVAHGCMFIMFIARMASACVRVGSLKAGARQSKFEAPRKAATARCTLASGSLCGVNLCAMLVAAATTAC